MLSQDQRTRYKRNLLIPEIGTRGQEKLMKGRVLVVGAGGLGSAALYYLACAGIGYIGIVDSDRVELSNLQRQILHSTDDIRRLKVRSAMETLGRLNPDIRLKGYSERFSQANGHELVSGYDFVIDATDNFESKFLINDICIQARVPYCHAGILDLFGQAMTILPGKGACYRCVFGEVPPKGQVPSARDAGVLGAVAGVLGAVQAAEAVKYLTACGELLVGRLVSFEALQSKFREIPLPGPTCRVCRDAGLIDEDEITRPSRKEDGR
jgi:molybdopterin/thiamine biosynthesis adenylyltransferase